MAAIQLKDRLWLCDEPQVMGVLNVTPDSFSDGGRFVDPVKAFDHAALMIRAGAAVIDVGGESTRPGSQRPSLDEELHRVVPVVAKVASSFPIVISVDTSRPEVMAEAAKAGAHLINDVRGLREPGAIEVCAQQRLAVALMHMQGEPNTMQISPHYEDVVREVMAYLKGRTTECLAAGIPASAIVWDVGFGFGKTAQHNLDLFKNLSAFIAEPHPLLVGVSRKSWVGVLTGRSDVHARVSGSIALATVAALWGAALIRAHDVAETVDALKIAQALRR